MEQKNYGIVPTIAELDEALAPRVYTSKNDGNPQITPSVDDGSMPDDGVLLLPDTVTFSGEEDDHIEVDHYSGLELGAGTIGLTFIANNVSNPRTLFSKDASGQEMGGHLTAFVWDHRHYCSSGLWKR